MHLLRPSAVDKSLCGSYHTAYLSPVAGHTICINLIRLIIRCFLVNLSCAKPGLRSPSRQMAIRSIFRKSNNGIPIDRPEAHYVSPGSVCVSLVTPIFFCIHVIAKRYLTLTSTRFDDIIFRVNWGLLNMITFYNWLINEKAMRNRSAKDVMSRIKRVEKIISSPGIDESTLEMLQSTDSYMNLSIFIRSQLKRAVTLYLEYRGQEKQ